ncbi:NERD domain-containing protein [Sutcliffiella rhizosphaerae]|uniref:NERD domain-containing protein n=1 Tax=Sutcliffiella rhizosphaerae TaxID=2880967 RepID=A0ABN8AAA2_9BACI|nr:NERD domain-containing protein [Sutcliffiella rhizosphaerae]CAG9622141.1 hypothetical protein BACCIP111883_02932 [Sutcliffiella rhizosphaerae]
MAQLIKLQDYITRYEADIFRYPSQYIRLKKQKWHIFEEMRRFPVAPSPEVVEVEKEQLKDNKWSTLVNTFKKKEEVEEELFVGKLNPSESDLEDDWELPELTERLTPEERKQKFLDSILPVQIKWASSTIRKISYLQQNYKKDSLLKYFLQRFPDTYFVMYKPIFLIKQAPVELEIIIITPSEILAIYYLDEQTDSVVLGSNERFWSVREKENERKLVNPTISLNRMGTIIKNILTPYEINYPIKKLLLHPKGYIDIFDVPTEVEVVDKRTYDNWFVKMRGNSLPLKANQLKAAGALLSHCQSTYMDRPEWQ